MFGQLITENSGGFIMKKSSLYFIYAILFAILCNVSDNKIVVVLTAICTVSYGVASLVLSYVEDKDKYN